MKLYRLHKIVFTGYISVRIDLLGVVFLALFFIAKNYLIMVHFHAFSIFICTFKKGR